VGDKNPKAYVHKGGVRILSYLAAAAPWFCVEALLGWLPRQTPTVAVLWVTHAGAACGFFGRAVALCHYLSAGVDGGALAHERCTPPARLHARLCAHKY
jgi:hypothetical protein